MDWRHPRPALLLCCTTLVGFIPITALRLHEQDVSSQPDPVAELGSGAKVNGRFLDSGNSRVASFFGLKYAEASRFEKPRIYEATEGEVIEAREEAPTCVQISSGGFSGQEDCLTLNILTPSVQGQRAVMVFLHGGFLVSGTGNALLPTTWSHDEDLVFVMPNYRLNVFGFLTPPESAGGAKDMPLNLGLRDQIAALQWVQRNIISFGGDPGRVTLAGQSAGARATLFLYNSPMATGLFQRAIVQSGGFVPAMGSEPSRKAAQSLGKRCFENANCTSVDCMKTLPIDRVVEACQMYMTESNFLGQVGSFFLGYDGEVLPHAIQAPYCEEAEVANGAVPLLIGGLKREWQLFELRGGISGHSMQERFVQEHADDVQRQQQGLLNSEQEGTALYSLALALGLPGEGKRYRYMLDFEEGKPFSFMASAHCADLSYLFDKGGMFGGDSTLHGPVGQMLRSYWASFAKTGVPSSPTGPVWTSYDANRGLSSPWLHVNSSGAQIAEPSESFLQSHRAYLDALCSST